MCTEHLHVYCMLCYYRQQVPRRLGSSVGYSFTNIALTIYGCMAEHLLLVAKGAVDSHVLATAHRPHHSTPGGERAFPPILPFSYSVRLSLPCLRLFIQELKVKVYLCLSQCVSAALSIYPHLPSITLPFYHLPSVSPWVGEGKNLWYLWCFMEKPGNRVAQNSQSAHWCAWVMWLQERDWNIDRKSNRVREYNNKKQDNSRGRKE